MASRLAMTLYGLVLFPVAVEAQEAPSARDYAARPVEASATQCVSSRPSIFSGRARGTDCVVASSAPRCKLSRPSIFSGSSRGQTCVMQAAKPQEVAYRPSIFSGRAPSPAVQRVSSYAAGPVTSAGAMVTTQAVPVAQPRRAKVRRHSIFTGGRPRDAKSDVTSAPAE